MQQMYPVIYTILFLRCFIRGVIVGIITRGRRMLKGCDKSFSSVHEFAVLARRNARCAQILVRHCDRLAALRERAPLLRCALALRYEVCALHHKLVGPPLIAFLQCRQGVLQLDQVGFCLFPC